MGFTPGLFKSYTHTPPLHPHLQPGDPEPTTQHSQVWKGVRSGRERVFLRMGNDFSISSFKIIFPKLEVTCSGRKENGTKLRHQLATSEKRRVGVQSKETSNGFPKKLVHTGVHVHLTTLLVGDAQWYPSTAASLSQVTTPRAQPMAFL